MAGAEPGPGRLLDAEARGGQMARQMGAVHRDLSSEKPGRDGKSERAEGTEP